MTWFLTLSIQVHFSSYDLKSFQILCYAPQIETLYYWKMVCAFFHPLDIHFKSHENTLSFANDLTFKSLGSNLDDYSYILRIALCISPAFRKEYLSNNHCFSFIFSYSTFFLRWSSELVLYHLPILQMRTDTSNLKTP